MTIDARIDSWRVGSFPLEEVLQEYWRVGKHFVAPSVLQALARVREVLRADAEVRARQRGLLEFLDVALDKHDGSYDYRSYLALPLLALPYGGAYRDRPGAAAAQRDRLLALLVTDLLDFELRALDGLAVPLPQLRADPTLVAKRCRLGLRALAPALGRMGHLLGVDEHADALASARAACSAVRETVRPAEAAMLRTTMLPVYTLHDEYLFLRVLQSFETCFSFICTGLEAAITAVHEGTADAACACLEQCDAALQEAAPLFSLMATMRVDAFRVFRQYTEGASAIQSRAYKRLEALCSRPHPERLDSPGYRSVPELREQIGDGWDSLQGAYDAVHRSQRLSAVELAALRRGMAGFEDRVLAWRKTHHGLAVRMLGPATGTGYTQGTPYLHAVMTERLFAA